MLRYSKNDIFMSKKKWTAVTQLIVSNPMRFPLFVLARILGFRSLVHRLHTSYGSIFLRSNKTDWMVLRSLSLGEFEDLIIYKKNIEENCVIVDAGGYIGLSAILFSRMYPCSKIITIEPSPDNYNLLMRNVSGYKNVYPVFAALGAQDGIANLYDRNTGPWGYTITPSLTSKSHKSLALSDVVTIETILKKFNFSEIGVLKLDIEGGEKVVLDSAKNWIDSCHVLVAELHDRIVPGCSESFECISKSRKIVSIGSEKYLSVRCSENQLL